ncbi:GRIP and coiled-coil domain-containing protein 1 [Pseudonaja textilis]|uniref:GRIP and coiled-coil domain-containing protein 1 n=1 Tax=Pseudonaja textilis TaxID=8673 RepID=UPI000EAA4253|nr:GRIP and coiled-coil domain-containing protein 1 [Pseudonaja textilis]
MRALKKCLAFHCPPDSQTGVAAAPAHHGPSWVSSPGDGGRGRRLFPSRLREAAKDSAGSLGGCPISTSGPPEGPALTSRLLLRPPGAAADRPSLPEAPSQPRSPRPGSRASSFPPGPPGHGAGGRRIAASGAGRLFCSCVPWRSWDARGLLDRFSHSRRALPLRAAQADEHLRMGEQHVAALEARISEMSELLGAYEKARQKDQAALQKLKDRLLQLDLENKTLAVAASGHATVGLALEDGRLDANVLRDQVEKLTELALVAAEHAPPLVGDGEAVCPAEPAKDAESGDGEKATLACYQQELKQLKEEFERYKARAQVVLKNKSAKDGNLARELEESQEQLLELKEKYVSLRLSCEEEAKQHQEQLEAKRREAALLQQLHRQELERCLSEGREKALRLEEEMHKQRDRALAVLMEKDQELQQLRALSVPFGVQAPKTATGPGSGGSGSAHSDSGVGDDALEHLALPLPAPSEPTFLLYTEQLARKEVEILALKKQKHQLEVEARQLQEKLLEEGEKHREELSLLQGHLQKTSRDRSREGANLEYLKNVFYRFLTLTDLLARQQTLTAILTILHFSPEERQAVLSHVGASSGWWLSGQR